MPGSGSQNRIKLMKGKPNDAVKESLRYNSAKVLSRSAKLVKLFLIRQLTRKQTELDKNSSEFEEQTNKISERLDWLKVTSHNDIGNILSNDLTIVGADAQLVSSNSSPLASIMIRAFRKHSRMVKTFKDLEEKIKKVLERNSYLRSKQQRSEAKKAKIIKREEEKAAKKGTKTSEESDIEKPKVKSRYINMVSVLIYKYQFCNNITESRFLFAPYDNFSNLPTYLLTY